MKKFIMIMLAALFVPMAASAGVGFGYDSVGEVEGLSVRFSAGPVALGVVGSVDMNADITDIPLSRLASISANTLELGIKAVFALGDTVTGAAGVARPQMWFGVGANVTDFELNDPATDPLPAIDSITDWSGEWMIGGEWRPVPNLGLSGGAGLIFVLHDEADDTIGSAGSFAFHIYF